MLVAIIDDGISATQIPKNQLVYDLYINSEGKAVERTKQNPIVTNHGTQVAQIISKYSLKTSFCSLKIFDGVNLRTEEKRLIAALMWCYNHDIKIVNVSVGTSSIIHYEAIRAVVAKMVCKKQIIVAACSNQYKYSLPSGLSGVFCVRTNAELEGFSYRRAPNSYGMAFEASSKHMLLGGSTVPSNSYAAPTITAAVNNICAIQNGSSFDALDMYRTLTGHTPIFLRPEYICQAKIHDSTNQQIEYSKLFFKHTGQSSRHENQAINPPVIDTLILLEKNNKRTNKSSKKIRSTSISLFKNGDEKELASPSRWVWEMKSQKCLSNKTTWHSDDDWKIPTIYIAETTERYTLDLYAEITKRGYNCLCLSNGDIDWLYGMMYCSSFEYLTSYLQDLYSSEQIDILIYCDRRDKPLNVNIDDSHTHILYLKCKKNTILTDGIISKSIYINSQKQEIKQLVDEIVYFFT